MPHICAYCADNRHTIETEKTASETTETASEKMKSIQELYPADTKNSWMKRWPLIPLLTLRSSNRTFLMFINR